jgi:enoyl-CoA hydratase/carnithine racemase
MGEPRKLRNVLVEDVDSRLLIVSFDRPEARNALNTDTSLDLFDIFGPLAFTPGDLRCIILTATGETAFSAGGDLKERRGMDDAGWRAQHAIIEEAAYAVMNCAVPVIAAVNGVAMGGGCELALCCDFIVAADTARFGLPEVTRGIMPGAGGTQNLPRAVGERRAKQLIMTGAHFSAAEALAWGMVNEVVPPANLLPRAREIADQICDNAPIAVRQVKKSIHQGLQMDMTSALAFEVQSYERMISTEDRHEGVAAFNEKRRPNFKGR